MSAKIYSSPSEVKLPSYDFKDVANWRKDEENYINELKQFLINNGFNGKNSGEVIKFPVADGYALYMVASMKPLQLIHLPLGDAWDFQYVHLLTAKEVQLKIDQDKKLAELFGRTK